MADVVMADIVMAYMAEILPSGHMISTTCMPYMYALVVRMCAHMHVRECMCACVHGC